MRFDVCSYFFAKNLALGENFLSPTLNIIQPIIQPISIHAFILVVSIIYYRLINKSTVNIQLPVSIFI